MRRLLALMFCLFLVVGAAQAATLYEQEGAAADGYAAINAAGHGPLTNPSSTNWIYQTGSGTWSGVYSWGTGWVETTGTPGDTPMDIECDIELYASQSWANQVIYFHLGNVAAAVMNDKTAYVTGSLSSNNGQYVGIAFNPLKATGSFEQVGGNYTGRILGGMVGTIDGRNRNISTENFNVVITMSENGGGYNPPTTVGTGADGTVPQAMWWLLGAGAPGSYTTAWKVVIEPTALQPDGNYKLDPTIVTCPVL